MERINNPIYSEISVFVQNRKVILTALFVGPFCSNLYLNANLFRSNLDQILVLESRGDLHLQK